MLPLLLSPEEKALPVIDLKPGELHVGVKPCIIRTLLGSCVAVCLHVPRLRVGAMCHGMLPHEHLSSRGKDPFCFVDTSVHYMVEQLRKLGGRDSEILAKLFGGADVTWADPLAPGRLPSIGQQNIAAARSLLEDYGIATISEKVGGNRGYKMLFFSETGRVLLRHLTKTPKEDDGKGRKKNTRSGR